MSGKRDKKLRQVARKITRGEYAEFIKSIPSMPLEYKKKLISNQMGGVGFFQRIYLAWHLVFGYGSRY